MNKENWNNLKIIYGLDLIVFGIVLACHLFIESFNFNDYWLLFIALPSLVDIIMNKINIVNTSVFILSTSLLSYFVFNNIWASLVTLAVLLGLLLLFGKSLAKKEQPKQ